MRPALDPDLRTLLAGMPPMPPLDINTLNQIRPYATSPLAPILEGRPIDHREATATASDGTPIPLSILSPAQPAAGAPCIYWIHGGGMVMGDRHSQIDIPLEWLDRFGAVIVSVDYRLAPEVTGTTLVDDCYQGLLWVAKHAAELGIDPSRLVVAGASAGGGLAAGVTLLARDQAGPAIAVQVLIGPMLDHRNNSTSALQYSGTPAVWTREMNTFAWRTVINNAEPVPAHVSPALADDLSGLPTTYLDAGSAEVFRDETVDYATRIWATGGQAELHIWAGGCHGFDALFPNTPISRAARRSRTDWLTRILNEEY